MPVVCYPARWLYKAGDFPFETIGDTPSQFVFDHPNAFTTENATDATWASNC